jgi:hypothetical protein
MPLCALFQAQQGTSVEPLTFHELAGKLFHIKESKDTGIVRIYSSDITPYQNTYSLKISLNSKTNKWNGKSVFRPI